MVFKSFKKKFETKTGFQSDNIRHFVFLLTMARTKQTARKSIHGPTRLPQATADGSNNNNDDGSRKKKKYRKRPGTKALQDIRKYQKSTELLIRKQPFFRYGIASVGM